MNDQATQTISSTTFQRNIGRVQAEVAMGKEHVVIEAHGRPMMVLLPAEDYEQLQRTRRECLSMRIDALKEAVAP